MDGRFNWMEKGIIAEVYSLDGEDACFAGNDHFTKFLGISAGRVSRRVTILVDKGFLIRGLKWTPRGRKRTLSVAPGVVEPIVENDNTPIVVSDDSQLPFSTLPIAGNDNYYKDENTIKSESTGEGTETPPPCAPLALKKDSPEEVSWTRYLIAKDQLEIHLPIDFFEFLEKEVIGQWDKIPWSGALVNNWHRQIWVKYGYEIASAAVSDCSAETKGWKISIAKVVEKCRVVRGRVIEAKHQAEYAERMKREKEELTKEDAGGFLGVSKMTDTELEEEYNRRVQDHAKPFILGSFTREMQRRKQAVSQEAQG